MSGKASHLDSEVVHSLRWIRLCRLRYVDENGVEREWDSCERTSRSTDDRSANCDGVDLITVLKKKNEEDRFVLVKQYSIEFPAGLIDQGDTPEKTALKELKEECGLKGKVISVSPILSMEPGLTSANCKIVHCEVDGDLEENQKPEQELEETEQIEVLYVKKSEFVEKLRFYSEKGCFVDAKLWTFAAGLSFSSQGTDEGKGELETEGEIDEK